MTLSERFASGLVRTSSGCLIWTKAAVKGYGRIRCDGKLVYTHRLAWTLANGPIPDGLHVLHHCDNPPCCETEPSGEHPEGHLFLGTQAVNNADMVSKGRHHQQKKTHCPSDHAYDEANTTITVAGRRVCRACQAIWNANRGSLK
jgi:hypothetical protein